MADVFDRLQGLAAKIPPPGPRSVGCAKCCGIFSSTGVVFLCVIGNLIKTQPLYVIGVDEPKAAYKASFNAAWIYVAMIAICVAVLAYDKINTQQRSSRGRGGRYPEYGSISYKSEF
mmetsp:Transcript_35868/g.114937  ORF Transcript_35868/g.114937 Transcript_35868/m.114937 type:complete len:117 (-) Transcript_35868:460-810(-)|eukprot:CAMPEP_0118889848 /NCGR_PEP_ID=MMETSP1166-20130328/579_1 /TAXON_ID=1104430 /ORGANISM="Chrysoreinhardia sp, Strain CCMP3193" /LENGTH=116 /DNA_ID=CAMNT_0006828445 /DNA_START=79 /DNA_END=429 /DNA_ORIENTATION=+